MVEVVAWCRAGTVVGAMSALGPVQRRRRMRRHPAPTFVFADLAGYAALTEERGDEAAARVAREFRRAMGR